MQKQSKYIKDGASYKKVEEYTYDYAGRLTKMTDPMGYTETYTYDTAGNVKTAKDKNGVITTNIYNNRGLLSRTSKGSEYIEYTYDGVGNILTSKDNNGTITYTYNYDGTLASKTYSDGKTITYSAYNANKALTSMTDYLGNTTTYTYNTRGLVTAIGEKYSGTSTMNTTRYTYNSDGSLQKITYPLSSYMTTTYTYDYAGRVSNLTNKLTSSSTYSTHAYTYDNSGNVTQKIDTIQGTAKTTNYTYDSENRLKSETISGVTTTYAYDAYNNLDSEINNNEKYYGYDKNNRLILIEEYGTEHKTADGDIVSDWSTYLDYDKNGNLLSNELCSMKNGNDGSEKSYTYDAWGRLIGFSDNLGETTSYSYYSDGLRSTKVVGIETIRYYYNGDNVINEIMNGNDYATNVVGIDGYISRKQNGTTGYLFKDAHGDVLSAYSSTTNKLADYTYDAWGEQQSVGNYTWGNANPIRYNGQYYDSESGMTYLRARYYDSNIRRFITEDPIKDGVNWYSYAGNNPVMFIDPTGYDKEGDERFSQSVQEDISLYGQIWSDAQTAYDLGIININEKESVQVYAERKADDIRYQADHPIITFFNKTAEFVVFDVVLGDFNGGTVYAADFSEDALEKMYGNQDNLSMIVEASPMVAMAAVSSSNKGRTLVNTKINGKMTRVDIEFPQGGKPANLHVQIKGTGQKVMIESIDDLAKLPKGVAKNSTIINTVKKGLKILGKLF